MQILVNGVISGLALALLALSFATVYLPTRVFFIAAAGIYTIVPYLCLALLRAGQPAYLACAIPVAAGCAISLLCDLLNHEPLNKRGASEGTQMISSLAIYILIAQITVLLWGTDTKVLRSGISDVFNLHGIILTREQITCVIVSLSVLAVFYFWLWLTRLGLEFRALASNEKEFALRGYNVRAVRLVAFAVAGLLCSISSLLTAYDVGFEPHGGLSAILLAVVAVIVGGRQSFVGPVVGAMLLAISRSEITWYLSARWEEAATFAFLAAFLFFRPQGLLGQKLRLEAES